MTLDQELAPKLYHQMGPTAFESPMFPTQPDIGCGGVFGPFHHPYAQAKVKPTFLDHQSLEAQVLPHTALVYVGTLNHVLPGRVSVCV